MLKLLLENLNNLIALYWIGEKVRLDPAINQVVQAFENNYSKINNFLSALQPLEATRRIRQFFGRAAVATGVLVFLLPIFRIQNPNIFFIFAAVCSITFACWGSLWWVLDHREVIKRSWKNVAKIAVLPILMGCLDQFLNTQLILEVLKSLQPLASILHCQLPTNLSPLAVGCLISFIIFLILAIYYLLIWLVSGFIALFAIFVISIPINLSKFIEKRFPSQGFLGFTVILYLVIYVLLKFV